MKAHPTPVKRRREKATSFRSCASSTHALNLVLEAVEAERDNLSRAESLIGCLKIAMEYGGETDGVPYYPDVAQIAGEMVRKSIQALDPIRLPNPGRCKVREEFTFEAAEPVAFADVPLSRLGILKTFPRKRLLRLHRRDYFRPFFLSEASSSASASPNTSG